MVHLFSNHPNALIKNKVQIKRKRNEKWVPKVAGVHRKECSENSKESTLVPVDFVACYSSSCPFSFTLEISCYKYTLTSCSPLSFIHTSLISRLSLSLTTDLTLSPQFALFVSLSSPSHFFPGVFLFPVRMALLSDQGAEIVIPVCAVIGIVFSLVQWYLVSKVKLSTERGGGASAASNGKNGYTEHLIEEEDGVADHDVVAKCAEIQKAISEGKNRYRSDFSRNFVCIMCVHVCVFFVPLLCLFI